MNYAYPRAHAQLNQNSNGNGSQKWWSKTRNFSGFFANHDWAAANGWKPMSKLNRQKFGFLGNLVFCHSGLREVMIPLLIKGPPELGATIGEPLIRHYGTRVFDTHNRRLKDGDPGVNQAYIAIADLADDGKYIGAVAILEFVKAMGDERPNPSSDPSKLPSYFWIDRDGKVSTLNDWRARQEEDDIVI